LGLGFANWTRDGEAVVGERGRRVVRLSPVTGQIEWEVDLSGVRLLRAHGVGWMGLAPDGSPLIMRDRSTRDISALEWEAP
jgi:hypothetical protein